MLGRKMDKPEPMQTNKKLLPHTESKNIQNDQKAVSIEPKYIDTDSNRPEQSELLNKIVPMHTDQCRFCEEEEETFIHLLNKCPVFNTMRQELLQGMPIINTTDQKPKTILKFAKKKTK